MIHFFNRTDLTLVSDQEEQVRIREKLAGAGIDYQMKVDSSLFLYGRGPLTQYQFYVKKQTTS